MQSSPFTDEQVDTLRAVVDRIIPQDDYPGAWDAGVGAYIVMLIGNDIEAVTTYELALSACDEEAKALGGHDFKSLSASDQDTVLTWIESGKTRTDWTFDPAAFFRSIVNHTMEGYYADPGNGGNFDAVSWKMIGFEVTA